MWTELILFNMTASHDYYPNQSLNCRIKTRITREHTGITLTYIMFRKMFCITDRTQIVLSGKTNKDS